MDPPSWVAVVTQLVLFIENERALRRIFRDIIFGSFSRTCFIDWANLSEPVTNSKSSRKQLGKKCFRPAKDPRLLRFDDTVDVKIIFVAILDFNM